MSRTLWVAVGAVSSSAMAVAVGATGCQTPNGVVAQEAGADADSPDVTSDVAGDEGVGPSACPVADGTFDCVRAWTDPYDGGSRVAKATCSRRSQMCIVVTVNGFQNYSESVSCADFADAGDVPGFAWDAGCLSACPTCACVSTYEPQQYPNQSCWDEADGGVTLSAYVSSGCYGCPPARLG